MLNFVASFLLLLLFDLYLFLILQILSFYHIFNWKWKLQVPAAAGQDAQKQGAVVLLHEGEHWLLSGNRLQLIEIRIVLGIDVF